VLREEWQVNDNTTHASDFAFDAASDFAFDAAVRLSEIIKQYKPGMVEEMLKRFKGEGFILAFLSDGGVLIPSDLSAEMGVSSARIAVVLRSLESKGLVTRATDESDHRRVLVSITDAGRERAETAVAEGRSNVERAFREMGEPDTREFLRTMRLFLDSISKATH
jgi:DNA-binding MarR family transcriptional regulator